MASTKSTATTLAKVMGVVAVFLGVFAIVNPVSAGNTFGLPTTPYSSLFVPVYGGRNIALGLAILALSYTNNRSGLGILFCSCAVAGAIDTVVCANAGAGVVAHIVGASFFAGVGGLFLRF